jgi:hypothetical protein
MDFSSTPNRSPVRYYDRQRTIEHLSVFLGHRDADHVTKADAVRWKEDALGRGRTASTVRNDISEMSAVWAWGIRNGKLRSDANPFHGTLPPKARKKGREPRAFTDAEAGGSSQATLARRPGKKKPQTNLGPSLRRRPRRNMKGRQGAGLSAIHLLVLAALG